MRTQPFSNGTEFMIWRERNCDRCKKDMEIIAGEYISHCDIEDALSFASVTDGMISNEIAERMGNPMDFKCPEIELIESEDE
jgi:hypothetical protein